jgi:opacity protein-like surface antigen
MKTFSMIAIALFLVPGIAHPADIDYPKYEIFSGFMMNRVSEFGASRFVSVGDFLLTYLGATDITAATPKFLNREFNASFAYNFTPRFGLEGSFRYNNGEIASVSGWIVEAAEPEAIQLKLKISDHAFMIGPRLVSRQYRNLNPFIHALVGLNHTTITRTAFYNGSEAEDPPVSGNGIGLSLGGGIDVKVIDAIALRLIQIDCHLIRNNAVLDYKATPYIQNLAISFGVVIRLGRLTKLH